MRVSIEFICMKKKKKKKTKTKRKKNKTKQIILKITFFSDMEYRKFLSESYEYEYEYEEYPDQDNYGSNKPQDTKTTSIGSTKKTSIRSTTPPTTDEISIKEMNKLVMLQKCLQQNLLNTI